MATFKSLSRLKGFPERLQQHWLSTSDDDQLEFVRITATACPSMDIIHWSPNREMGNADRWTRGGPIQPYFIVRDPDRNIIEIVRDEADISIR